MIKWNDLQCTWQCEKVTYSRSDSGEHGYTRWPECQARIYIIHTLESRVYCSTVLMGHNQHKNCVFFCFFLGGGGQSIWYLSVCAHFIVHCQKGASLFYLLFLVKKELAGWLACHTKIREQQSYNYLIFLLITYVYIGLVIVDEQLKSQQKYGEKKTNVLCT